MTTCIPRGARQIPWKEFEPLPNGHVSYCSLRLFSCGCFDSIASEAGCIRLSSDKGRASRNTVGIGLDEYSDLVNTN